MHVSIDIGTNSVRLYGAEYIDGKLIPVVRDLVITRLGQGVNETGQLHPTAIERTVKALVQFKSTLTNYLVDTISVIATSAVRDGANREQFIAAVKTATDWDIQVISGAKEAQLSFIGAIKSLQAYQGVLADQVCVLDIGGGSTELIQGTRAGRMIGGGTSQVGAVRMTESYISSHPVNDQELFLMELAIKERLQPLIDSFVSCSNFTLLGVGGTATTVAAIDLQLADYDALWVTGHTISKERVAVIYSRLAKLTTAQRLQMPGLQPGREDVIVAGVAILLQTMQLLNVTELVVSDGDLLQGVIYEKNCC